jgi:hypothetical protein
MPSKGPEIEYKRKATSQKNHWWKLFSTKPHGSKENLLRVNLGDSKVGLISLPGSNHIYGRWINNN